MGSQCAQPQTPYRAVKHQHCHFFIINNRVFQKILVFFFLRIKANKKNVPNQPAYPADQTANKR